ncbi:hypothetical protein N9W89_07380 [Hellea sp.]|nr:hypothetical protein [Hellea sp.]
MMDFGWWILLLPLLVGLILYLLFFFVLGSGVLWAGFKSRKFIYTVIGIGVITAPFTIEKIQKFRAGQKADAIYAQLAALERTSLKGRLPGKFVAVGSFSDSNVNFLRDQYGLRRFPKAENNRLEAAYRDYRRTEFCYKHDYDRIKAYREKYDPRNKLSICDDLPESIQASLKTKEPVLFIIEGRSTSFRQTRFMVGKKYEIRLVTSREDLLVDYYEDREIDDPPRITSPFSSGRKLDKDGPTPTMREFIQGALKGASR